MNDSITNLALLAGIWDPVLSLTFKKPKENQWFLKEGMFFGKKKGACGTTMGVKELVFFKRRVFSIDL